MKGWRGQQGFTLLEVMVSLAIVGGLLMTLIYTLNYNLGITEKLFAVTTMTNLAKEKLEEMETEPQETQGYFPAPYEVLNYETKVRDSAFPEITEIAVTVGDVRLALDGEDPQGVHHGGNIDFHRAAHGTGFAGEA